MNSMMEGVSSTIGSSRLFKDFHVWNVTNYYSVSKDQVLNRIPLQLKPPPRPISLYGFSKMDSVVIVTLRLVSPEWSLPFEVYIQNCSFPIVYVHAT
jgi:hypothetical protein